MQKPLPPVSVVICSRGRPKLLLGAVESVLAGDDTPAEIVVVDQSEKPNSAVERLTSVRYLWKTDAGLSRARNVGIAAAACGIVAVLDDDIIVAGQWLRSLVSVVVEGGPKTVVTGSVAQMPAGIPNGFAPSLRDDRERVVYKGAGVIGRLAMGNMGMYRTAFEEVGIFDPRLGAGSAYPSSEDNDFCYRLLSAGYQVVYEPAARVYHLAWRPASAFVPVRWAYGLGQGGFYAKHVSAGDGFILRTMAADLGRRMLRAPWRLCRGRWAAAAGDFFFAAGMIAGAARWFVTQPRGSDI